MNRLHDNLTNAAVTHTAVFVACTSRCVVLDFVETPVCIQVAGVIGGAAFERPYEFFNGRQYRHEAIGRKKLPQIPAAIRACVIGCAANWYRILPSLMSVK
jgi:hypothetical protein